MELKNYINEKVINKAGNTGFIEKVDDFIFVKHNDGTSRYQIDAFENGILKFVNAELQKIVDEEVDQKQKEAERLAKEIAYQAELRRIEREKKLQELAIKEKIKHRQSDKENEKNIAYKATYCDGEGSWFRRPCSKECMMNNIKLNRSWCSRSLCKDFLDGKVTKNDILNKYSVTKDLCYESRILEDFSVSAGLDEKTNNPRSFVKLEPERLVVLTTIEPNSRGNERIIFGAFLVESIVRDGAGADKAISQRDYRIELTINEARKMRFWDYYENSNAPDSERWGQGLIRYLSDDLSAEILYNMVEIIKKRGNANDTANANAFLDELEPHTRFIYELGSFYIIF